MTEHSTVLSKGRKKRAMSATLATPEEIGGFGLLGTHPLHKTSKVRCAGPHVAPVDGLLLVQLKALAGCEPLLCLAH